LNGERAVRRGAKPPEAVPAAATSLKALRIHTCDGAEVLRCEEAADPALEAPGDVIVKVRAAAVNRDAGQRPAPPAPQRIPGSDGAGTVVALGATTGNLKIGDSVCFYPFVSCGGCVECAAGREDLCAARSVLGVDRHGTFAEYIALPASNCFSIPTRLSFAEAAALPSAYLTVWRLLIAQARLQPGESLLIAGAGGVGSAALVLGRALSARVFVVSREAEKRAKAKTLGAEQVFDASGDWVKGVRSFTGKRGVDVIVDSVGGESWSRSLAALARGGRLVTCGAVAGDDAPTDLRRVFWNHLKIFGASSASREDFRRLLDFFSVSGFKPVIDRVYPLGDAAAAHRRVKQGAAFGKIILTAGV